MKANNAYYWNGRSERARKAKEHIAEMAKKYSARIDFSVQNTMLYDAKEHMFLQPDMAPGKITMRAERADTVSAVLETAEEGKKTAVLNFASYKYPGGAFVNGSKAQEECLCHESFLYNVLKTFDGSYYEWNRQNLNHALYKDRALYSPSVGFMRGSKYVECDVITCAAPNWSVASARKTLEENERALKERIRFVLNIAREQKVNKLILGAFGCGVFLQDPTTVAECFVEEAKRIFDGIQIEIVFAVIPPLPNQADNYTPFFKAVKA